MQLRPYQLEAVEAVYRHLRERDDHPCVVLPTAAGKTPCIATICRDAVQRWHGRVLILAHVKELLEQAADKLRTIAPDVPVGVYSAGLKRRDLGYAVTIEHDGYARQKATAWWRQRSTEPVPDTAEQAVELAEMGALAPTVAITVQHTPGEKYDRIVGYRLGDRPARPESAEDLPEYVPPIDESEIPF